MRVVLDTNVLISAALKPSGLEAAIVNAILAGQFEAWVTSEIWTEYEEVLARPKFASVRDESQRILSALEGRVQTTRAIPAPAAALDGDDNRFLECAFAANADFLITGNLRHYPPACGSTRVVNGRGFHDRIATPHD